MIEFEDLLFASSNRDGAVCHAGSLGLHGVFVTGR
jgi:hypothetical protein